MATSNYTRSSELVSIQDGKSTTTSLIVAKHFKKDHFHVLRDIEKLQCSQEFRASNFGLSNRLNKQGKSMPYYVISRDGFTMLCMGFEGAEAAAWKEKYIAAFNMMEKQLKLDFNTMPPELLDHLSRKQQVVNVKQVNGVLYENLKDDPHTTGFAEYHTRVCLRVSNDHIKPHHMVEKAKSMGVPSKYRTSGREAMRVVEPASACAASFTDMAMSRGATMADALSLADTAKSLFQGMLKLGIVPRELLT